MVIVLGLPICHVLLAKIQLFCGMESVYLSVQLDTHKLLLLLNHSVNLALPIARIVTSHLVMELNALSVRELCT